MPCNDGGYSYSAIEEDEDLISDLEQMLCSASRALKRLGFDFDENPQLSRWWAKHQEQDLLEQAEALKSEQRLKYILALAQQPYSSLSNDERKLLADFYRE